MLLINTMDSSEVAYEFLHGVEVTLPSLLDGEEVYNSYPRKPNYAPFPLQVVIDREGTIRYVAYQYDAAAVRAVLDQILAE